MKQDELAKEIQRLRDRLAMTIRENRKLKAEVNNQIKQRALNDLIPSKLERIGSYLKSELSPQKIAKLSKKNKLFKGLLTPRQIVKRGDDLRIIHLCGELGIEYMDEKGDRITNIKDYKGKKHPIPKGGDWHDRYKNKCWYREGMDGLGWHEQCDCRDDKGDTCYGVYYVVANWKAKYKAGETPEGMHEIFDTGTYEVFEPVTIRKKWEKNR